MLGHEVKFRYCREPGAPLPCRKIFDCWWETFDVRQFIDAHYSEEQIKQVLAPRADKMTSLVDLIQQARERQQRDSE
jgi:hypothetical protein